MSGIGETVSLIHPGAKFLPICGPVKLESRKSAPKYNWLPIQPEQMIFCGT